MTPKYSKKDKELIAENFLDLMLHEMFGVPAAVHTHFDINRLTYEPLHDDDIGIKRQLFWSIQNLKEQNIPALMDCVAKEQPNHKCLQALQFFKTLYDREGLEGVGDFLIRNLPKEREALKKLSLDTGEKRCLLEDKTRDAAVRHTRRSFLCAAAVIPAIALIATADEAKQRMKFKLYDALNNQPRRAGITRSQGMFPASEGISRGDFMAGRTWAPPLMAKHLGKNNEDGVTDFDLQLVPSLPSSSPREWDSFIHVKDGKDHFYYRFPSDEAGQALRQQYLWMHQTVQPVGVLMALGAAGMSVIHLAALADIKLHRKRAAKELVEPLCQVFSGVMDAMDAQAEKELKTHER